MARLIFALVAEFYTEAAGRALMTGMIVPHQTYGEMLRFNPHFHAIVLEGGFDNEGTFFYIPFTGLDAMVEVFRQLVVWLLVEKELLDEDFAIRLLGWKHSGSSIDNSVRILDREAQTNLAKYISRPPISLEKICYEPFKGRVLFHTKYSEYFKENVHIFDALDFLRWARLLARVYEVDSLICPKCGSPMKVIEVIQDLDEIRSILRHLIKIGGARPACAAGAGEVRCELNRTPPTVVVNADSSVSCDPLRRFPPDSGVRPVVPRSICLSASPMSSGGSAHQTILYRSSVGPPGSIKNVCPSNAF